MAWYRKALDRLAQQPCCGYLPEGAVSTEPTALSALALLRGGATEGGVRALNRLRKLQNDDGSVGVSAARPLPCWATGWAVQAWAAAAEAGVGDAAERDDWQAAAGRACDWLLAVAGRPVSRDAEGASFFGHDTTLRGWPWVETTHSWVEPTAISVLALKRMGFSDHDRTREAIRLLNDRMLVLGGWNYGNTVVLGNVLRPHVQPTGLALWALGDEPSAEANRVISSTWLLGKLSAETATASLCYALLGLRACGRKADDAERWLEAAYDRTMSRDGSPYRIALLLLAAEASP